METSNTSSLPTSNAGGGGTSPSFQSIASGLNCAHVANDKPSMPATTKDLNIMLVTPGSSHLTVEAGLRVGLKTGAGWQLEPRASHHFVLGFVPWQRDNAYRRRFSLVMGQKNQLWWDIPAADSYDLLTRIYDIDKAKAKKRIQVLCEVLKCQDQLNIQLRRLSLGERMKMEIVGALLHQPDVLFLDAANGIAMMPRCVGIAKTIRGQPTRCC